MICRIGETVLVGVIGGPPVALALELLLGRGFQPILESPFIWLIRSAFIGTVFALSFSLLCGPPVKYVGRKLSGIPAWKLRTIILLTGFCGGSVALLIVASVLSWTLDLHFRGPLRLESWAVIDGVIAAGLGLVVNSYGRLKAERDAAEARAEAAALTAQIRPHFLFNTLNAISAQVKHDPDAAQENLGRLADMFRYTMHHARQDLVPLADEIALTREYLFLEKARLGERLSFELPQPVAEVQMPGLTLQPLVENAVRHGISKRIDGGCIRVSLEGAPQQWTLRVRNPISVNGAIPEERLFQEGHALWILKKRFPALRVRQEPGLFEVVVPL